MYNLLPLAKQLPAAKESIVMTDLRTDMVSDLSPSMTRKSDPSTAASSEPFDLEKKNKEPSHFT